MNDILTRLMIVWEADKEMIIGGAAALLLPSVIRGRGRPSRLFQLVQLGGLGILAYVAYKHKDTLFK